MLAFKVVVCSLVFVAAHGFIYGDKVNNTVFPITKDFLVNITVDCGKKPITNQLKLNVWDDLQGGGYHGKDNFIISLVPKILAGSPKGIFAVHLDKLNAGGSAVGNVKLYYIFENFCKVGDQIRFGDVFRGIYFLDL